MFKLSEGESLLPAAMREYVNWTKWTCKVDGRPGRIGAMIASTSFVKYCLSETTFRLIEVIKHSFVVIIKIIKCPLIKI